ncbi:aminotransferase class I/II-fold pyridoxal phosphate-dependent enzyme [Paenibacillus marinisediminis]
MSNEWISPLVRDIPPSGIRAFFDLCDGNQDVVSLGVGEPDFATPEHIREACIRALYNGKTMYTSNAGLMELREEIAGYLKDSFQLSYDPVSEMMVTVGSSEAVDLALRTLIAPGDEVLIPSPSYIAYSPITHLHGGKVVEVETRAEDSFKLTASALQAAITPKSKVLMVNFPSNPTGAIMTYEDWLPVIEVIKANNLVVISDEIYAELTFGQKHVSLAALPGMAERTVLISGFSKAFAMTGWRVGYACGNREIIANMLKIHQYTAMCAPILGQIAALESLRHGMEAKDMMRESYDQRRRMFVRGLSDIGFTCREPEGTFYAFPSIAHTGLRSEQFAMLLLKQAGVAVVPGHVFGSSGEGHIRCSFATSTSKLEEALERMERFMNSVESEKLRMIV